MKLSLEIDLEPHLTAEEIEAFRRQCEKEETRVEASIATLIREAIAENERRAAA